MFEMLKYIAQAIDEKKEREGKKKKKENKEHTKFIKYIIMFKYKKIKINS